MQQISLESETKFGTQQVEEEENSSRQKEQMFLFSLTPCLLGAGRREILEKEPRRERAEGVRVREREAKDIPSAQFKVVFSITNTQQQQRTETPTNSRRGGVEKRVEKK